MGLRASATALVLGISLVLTVVSSILFFVL
jgi:hypothetical protein